MMKWITRVIAALVLLGVLAAAWLWFVNFRDGVDVATGPQASTDPAIIERGAYLARVGNCLACHTARGGTPGAGGLPIPTEFGTAYSLNLTPDDDTGIGTWNANTFWRAVHYGRGADGRLLIPVFPYTHSTLMARGDVDALFAYFKSLPAAKSVAPEQELRWPYGTQPALAVWRARYFKPGSYQADPQQNDTWNLGAYMVQGVAHCSVCHAQRDSMGGANWTNLNGAPLKGQGWYAPSLVDGRQAGLGGWSATEIARLLRVGVTKQGRVNGPMAETVMHGTQYLSSNDAEAMGTYLRSLPQTASTPTTDSAAAAPAQVAGGRVQVGEKLYGKHCAECHGDQGEGVGEAYPPLAGNRAVTMPVVDNLVQVVLNGGFNPVTEGYPRPFGMPPFALDLTDNEVASVLSYVRNAWGNRAGSVSRFKVQDIRKGSPALDDAH